MAEQNGERTEPATARRKEEARQEGNVARSADLTAAAMLLAGVILLQYTGLRFMSGLKLSLESLLRNDFTSNPTRPDDLMNLFAYAVRMGLDVLMPMLLSLAAVGLVAAAGQVGFRITPKVLEPNFMKLSPLRGLKNLFDFRGVVRMTMSLSKLLVVFGVAGWFMYADLPRIITLGELPLLPVFNLACTIIYQLAIKLAVLLLVLAFMDYSFQRWQRERDLRMTKQELKEEFKRMDGDPLVKQRRTRVARQLAMQRIGAAVPKSNVIVTNPTHFAVALQYEPGTMRAPKVVAKGADFLAMHIRQLAALHGIPIVERKELARALYAGVEVNQEVPPQFYNAVAEVLAYVFRLSGRKIA
ncbi:MAG: flagellar biosynthesis protein FlhB [Phycisphaerales bacterium]|nr:flagellar biosynthesis protein FlhB [Phycisphaerales bacterium]